MPAREYRKRPIPSRLDTTALYARYRQEQEGRRAFMAERLVDLRRRKNDAIEAAKQANRGRRLLIKCMSRGVGKRLLYSHASRLMKVRLARIHAEYTRERESVYQDGRRLAWADWLRQQAVAGDDMALRALIARKPKGAIGSNDAAVFGSGLAQVMGDASSQVLSMALQLTAQRYGSEITVSGTSAFREQILLASVEHEVPITFADPALERRRQEMIKVLELQKGVDPHQKRKEPDHEKPLRQPIQDQETGVEAAQRYVAERESKRGKGINIQERVLYNGQKVEATFQGIRNIDGQALALLRHGEQIMVKLVDRATAQRLSKVSPGSTVRVTQTGSIKTTKGRSR